MTPNGYAFNRIAALRAPLAGPNARAWATALGGAQDDEAPLVRVAGVARSLSRAPDDALVPVLGSLYARPRSPRETNTPDVYRSRLGGAWAFWEAAQLMGGFGDVAAPYAVAGYPLAWRSAVEGFLSCAPSWFSLVGGIWAGALAADAAWDDGETWDDGGLWNVYYDANDPYSAPSFGVADLGWLRREVRNVKASGCYPVAIAAGTALDAQGWSAIWNDGGTWDDGGVWDDPDPSSVVYLTLGHVWGEELWIGGGPGLWDTPRDTWDDYEPPTGGW